MNILHKGASQKLAFIDDLIGRQRRLKLLHTCLENIDGCIAVILHTHFKKLLKQAGQLFGFVGTGLFFNGT